MDRKTKIDFCKSISIADVCKDIGKVEFVGSRKSAKSPFRENSSKNAFSIDERKNIFTDWGFPTSDSPRGVLSGDPIDFVKNYYGCSFGEAVDILWKQYHGGTIDAKPIDRIKPKTPKNMVPDLTAEELDKAYRVFLSLSTLDDRSHKALLERDLSDEEISEYGFKTFPKRIIKRELNQRLLSLGIRPEAVPGLYVRSGDHEASFKYYESIVIPVKGVTGLISGLQLRFFNKGDGPRYIWFSSSGCEAPNFAYTGKTPGTPIAFIDSVKRNNKTLFITEGIFKAIAINKCYGCPVLAVQGVGNFQGIENSMQEVLKLYPINRVLIAYDADFIGNINVTAQAVRLYQTLKTFFPDKKYQYLMWSERYGKGFDDLIKTTGGWNVKSVITTLDMENFSNAFEKFKPVGIQLLKEGKRDEIAPLFKKYLI